MSGNLIECKYGHHLADKDKDFTPSGLNNKFLTTCKKCKSESMKKYRQKHKDEYRERHKLYQRRWKAAKKNSSQNIETNGEGDLCK